MPSVLYLIAFAFLQPLVLQLLLWFGSLSRDCWNRRLPMGCFDTHAVKGCVYTCLRVLAVSDVWELQPGTHLLVTHNGRCAPIHASTCRVRQSLPPRPPNHLYPWLHCGQAQKKRRKQLDITFAVPIRGRLTAVTDEDLETNIRQLQSLYPNSGTAMMRGLLHARGLVVPRRKVREMMARINPMATARRWSSAVSRRVYHVPYPNSLWHIDGNMRLIRWGFVVHGGIDGCSRLITYLNCSTDSRASTVLFHFLKATGLYGLPSRVRSDHGGENVQVALVMNLLQGIERRSHLTGESIHNQRIERLWRDVFLHVLEPFYSTFYNLEDSALLDPSNDVHKLSLHIVFLPENTSI
ncbi:uncharacterized protein ACNS7B_023350 [Menidia menidia]